MSTTPAAWYPDPSGTSHLLRWWDGTAWTAHTQPAQPVQLPSQGAGVVPTQQGTPSSEAIHGTLLSKASGGLLGGKKALEEENQQLRTALAALGVTEQAQLQAELGRLRGELAAFHTAMAEQHAAARASLAALQAEVVTVEETAILQEVGVYAYSHPLDSAAAYKDRLAVIQADIKAMVKGNRAVIGATSWTVNGSQREGTKMVTDFSKLMLRAYNNEADNAVRSMKPHAVRSGVERLEKARATISKLGKTMAIVVTDAYHSLRVEELQLTADFMQKLAEEKEREREEKARLREEEKARREFEREKERLLKEAAHYQAAMAAMQANGDTAAAADAQAMLAQIQAAIDGVDSRAANIRAGYVYVISNIGSFGERMVKIGMTRRLEPLDRVRELGDASVPFRYDTHALIFSNDAVGLEARLHQEFAAQKVNLINAQREFFYVTPHEVKAALELIEGSNLLTFDEIPEALEWHQSENMRPPSGDALV